MTPTPLYTSNGLRLALASARRWQAHFDDVSSACTVLSNANCTSCTTLVALRRYPSNGYRRRNADTAVDEVLGRRRGSARAAAAKEVPGEGKTAPAPAPAPALALAPAAAKGTMGGTTRGMLTSRSANPSPETAFTNSCSAALSTAAVTATPPTSRTSCARCAAAVAHGNTVLRTSTPRQAACSGTATAAPRASSARMRAADARPTRPRHSRCSDKATRVRARMQATSRRVCHPRHCACRRRTTACLRTFRARRRTRNPRPAAVNVNAALLAFHWRRARARTATMRSRWRRRARSNVRAWSFFNLKPRLANDRKTDSWSGNDNLGRPFLWLFWWLPCPALPAFLCLMTLRCVSATVATCTEGSWSMPEGNDVTCSGQSRLPPGTESPGAGCTPSKARQ